MNRAAPFPESSDALELRVLEGVQRGARMTLRAGASCVISIAPSISADDADVVLRDASAGPTRVRVTGAFPNAVLEVLEGEVQLCDTPLRTGKSTLWTAYAPLRVGATVVAFGLGSQCDWPKSNVVAIRRTRFYRRLEVWLGAMGVSVLLAYGALGLAHEESPLAASSPSEALELAPLRGSEFTTLKAVAGPNDVLTLRGRLDSVAQRQRLYAWVAARQLNATIEVFVDESIAHELTEVFRVNGIAAKAGIVAPGHFLVEVAEPDRARLARAEEVVRRDVRGVEALEVRNTAKPLPPPPPPVPSDPAKRIVSVVPDEPAYLVTADGARYFIGALLPSGHRIIHIERFRITVDRDGVQSTLNL